MTEKKIAFGYEMNFAYLVKLCWRRGLIILICTALTCVLAVSYAALLVPDRYSSTVKFYVNNSFPGDKEESISSSEILAAGELLDVYIVILKSEPTLERIAESSALDVSVKKLERMISAASVDGTEVFSVTVKAESAETSQKIAHAVTEVLPDRIAEVVEGSSVKLVQGAANPGEKTSSGIFKYAAIGAVAGIILSSAAVVIYDVFDRTLKDEKQLKTFGCSVLARVSTRKKNSAAEYRKAADLIRVKETKVIGVTDLEIAYSLKDALYDFGEDVEIVDARTITGEKTVSLSNDGYSVMILPHDSLFAAKETDGVIVPITYGKTRADDLEELVDRMSFSSIELLGFVTFDK